MCHERYPTVSVVVPESIPNDKVGPVSNTFQRFGTTERSARLAAAADWGARYDWAV
jgi:hypothetical protein